MYDAPLCVKLLVVGGFRRAGCKIKGKGAGICGGAGGDTERVNNVYRLLQTHPNIIIPAATEKLSIAQSVFDTIIGRSL